MGCPIFLVDKHDCENLGAFVAASQAQCMAYVNVWWSIGCTQPKPFHFEDKALPCDPNMMSLWWGKLYLFSAVGHINGDE